MSPLYTPVNRVPSTRKHRIGTGPCHVPTEGILATEGTARELPSGHDALSPGWADLGAAAAAPAGTITFLFTDIEGSTRLLDRLRARYAEMLALQRDLLRDCFARWRGHEVDTQGDSFFAVFPSAADALRCAIDAQRAIGAQPWPDEVEVRVRMGIHTGEPMVGPTGYVGMAVHRAARIAAAGHGGQILLSGTTADLVVDDVPDGSRLQDLGSHKLKDLRGETRIHQVHAPGLATQFPALKTAAADEPPPTPGDPPYLGLRAFDEDDAALFFGREKAVRGLVDRLDSVRFLALIGASGSGKSSILRAGILPELRARGTGARIVLLKPTAHPLESLAVAVTDDGSRAEIGRFVDDMRRDLRSLALQLRTGPGTTVLAVDQLEEVFTLCRDEDERAAFLGNLAYAAGLEESAATSPPDADRARLIITLRADFYALLAPYERLREAAAASQAYVGPMSGEELRRAIEGPAAAGGWDFVPGLIDLLLRDVGDEPGALPLLSHALLETWGRRRGTTMTLKGYAESGEVQGAIARTADTVYHARLSEEQRAIARSIFVRLTELGEGTQDTRRRARLVELLPADPKQAGAVREVLRGLADARLITVGEESVEVAHEALIREWPTLREWLRSDREGLRVYRRLTEASQDWELAGFDAGILYRGSRLAQAAEWAAGNANGMNDLERRFLEASREQLERDEAEREAVRRREVEAAQAVAAAESIRAAAAARARNRLRALVAVLAVGALLASGLSIFALAESDRAAREARGASARGLAAAAVANLGVDPERSILLALEAVDATRSSDGSVLAEAEDALHRAVTTSRIVLRVPGVGGALAWSPDGSVFVTEGPEDSGVLDIRSAATGESVLAWHGHDVDVNAVAFSPDGSMLATTGDDGTAAVWDPETGDEVSRFAGSGQVWGPTFTPDGSQVAAVWTDEGLLRVWDLATARLLHEIAIEGILVGAAFSPDGGSIVVPRGDTALVLHLATGEETVLDHRISVFDAAWSPDGRWIATAGRVPAARIWDATTGQLIYTVGGQLAHNGEAYAVAWSPDSSRLATSGSDGSAKVWEISDEGTYEALSLAGQDTALGIDGLAFSPDGSHLMTGDRAITGVQIWNVSQTGSAEWATIAGRYGDQGALAFAPDGRLIVSGEDGSVAVLNGRTAEALQAVGDHDDVVAGIAVSPDGELIATAGGADGTARVWDAATERQVFEVQHGAMVRAVAWSADGALLATAADDGQIIIVDRSGGEVAVLSDHPGSDIHTVEFSADGRWLGVAREGREDDGPSSVVVWEWEKDRIHVTLPVPALDLAFDSSGARIATTGFALGVQVWDVESGEPLPSLAGQAAPLWAVAFSPDDSMLAAGGFEGAVRLWDVESGVQRLVLGGHTAPVIGLAFSADSSQLASTSLDGTVRVWAIDLDDLIVVARSKLQRALSDEECRQYLQLTACQAAE